MPFVYEKVCQENIPIHVAKNYHLLLHTVTRPSEISHQVLSSTSSSWLMAFYLHL